MRLSLETGDHANLAYFLDATAVLEAAEGQHARVPLLLGAAQGIREAVGSRGYGYYRPDPAGDEAAADEARAHLGADRYDDALDVGRGTATRRRPPRSPSASGARRLRDPHTTRTPRTVRGGVGAAGTDGWGAAPNRADPTTTGVPP